MEPWCKPQKHRNKPGSGITELVTSSRPRRILDPSQVRTYHRLYLSFDASKLDWSAATPIPMRSLARVQAVRRESMCSPSGKTDLDHTRSRSFYRSPA
jgi:hypothetical protein